MKGLSECKALESNIRRFQVKDIVKEDKDYLKTYSSVEMDISTVGLEELMQWGTSAAGYGGHRTRVGSANPGQASRLSATTATGYAT
ncbi:hypothetical protein Tco_1484187 [Tanacetum coccineum]